MSKLTKIFPRSFIVGFLICTVCMLIFSSLCYYGQIHLYEVKPDPVNILQAHPWYVFLLIIANGSIICLFNLAYRHLSLRWPIIPSAILALILPLISAKLTVDYSHHFLPELEPQAEPPPNAWHFDFSEVRAYQINWDDEYNCLSILQEDQLNETRFPKEGVLLTDQQVEDLRHAICNRRITGAIGMCRYPHHALLFYTDTGDIVGHFDICFMCNNSGGFPVGYSGFPDHDELKSLFTSLGIPISNPAWDNADP